MIRDRILHNRVNSGDTQQLVSMTLDLFERSNMVTKSYRSGTRGVFYSEAVVVVLGRFFNNAFGCFGL